MGAEMTPNGKHGDVFAPFIEAATAHLRFLITEFGLKALPPLIAAPGATVMYRAAGLEVAAHYEYGSRPWIGVSLKDDTHGWRETSLSSLLGRKYKRSEAASRGPVDYDKILKQDALQLRVVLPAMLTRVPASLEKALARDRQGLCNTALRKLARFEDTFSERLTSKGRKYLKSLRHALALCDSKRVESLLDATSQLKQDFGRFVEGDPAAKALLDEVTIAVQDCLS
jgi:hypothetical protein